MSDRQDTSGSEEGFVKVSDASTSGPSPLTKQSSLPVDSPPASHTSSHSTASYDSNPPSPEEVNRSSDEVRTRDINSKSMVNESKAQAVESKSRWGKPLLERSHTVSELMGLKRSSSNGCKPLERVHTGLPLKATSFEIESVSMPSDGISEIDIDKTTHTVFEIEVKLHGGLSWKIQKRYSDFRDLHDRLRKWNNHVKTLSFPKRHIFRSRLPAVIEQRRSELEKYLVEVLAVRPKIQVPLHNFLEVHAHMESFERKLERHKKELEWERKKHLLPQDELDSLSLAFKHLCSSRYLLHGDSSCKRLEKTEEESKESHRDSLHTEGSQICISRTAFRRDILGVFPDMPSNFALRFIKAVSDRHASDINMDEFLRAVAILRAGSLTDQLSFVYAMCDLDHANKLQHTGLGNLLLFLYGRQVLDKSEYQTLVDDVFDQGRAKLELEPFLSTVPSFPNSCNLLVGWMPSFVDTLCESVDQKLLESQEEFNPTVQQKILANDTHFEEAEVGVLLEAFSNYRTTDRGDGIDMEALMTDFPLEMSAEQFRRVFSTLGSRANGEDIDIFSFVHALSASCRGTLEEKAELAFKVFADGELLSRDGLYGMLRLDLAQSPELEQKVLDALEKIERKSHHQRSSSSSILYDGLVIETDDGRNPSVSGSELGRFVDWTMRRFGKRRSVSETKPRPSPSMTLDEFTRWAVDETYEVSCARTMRTVAFVDLELSPANKEEELKLAKDCYKPYDDTALVEDETWYLLERKWFSHWSKYSGFQPTRGEGLLSTPVEPKPSSTTSASNSAVKGTTPQKSSTPSTTSSPEKSSSSSIIDADGNYTRPKFINNYPLLSNDRRETALKSSDEIRINRHFVVVCERLWCALKLWYGGGPEVARRVVKFADGETKLDVWETAGQEEAADTSSEEDTERRKEALALPKKLRNGGSTGLTNMGNTCYMNSALQCLANTQLLAEYFLSGMYLDDVNDSNALGAQGKLAEAYGRLMEDVWTLKQKAISPRNFKKAMAKLNDAFKGNDQQDAQELLSFLLSGLSEDLNRIEEKPYVEQPDSDGRFDADLADEWWRNHLRREVSIIVALFTGQYKSLLTCQICGFKSARFEPFTFLQVPLPEPTHSTVTLLLVLADGRAPLKVSVRLEISATILDLKQALVTLMTNELGIEDVEASNLKVCEYNGPTIQSFKSDMRRVGQIRSIERLIAYQLEKVPRDTWNATRSRRQSWGNVEEEESEEVEEEEVVEELEVRTGALVEARVHTHSAEFVPGVIIDCLEDEVLVRLGRNEETVRVPLSRVRARQPRLLYLPLMSRKLSYSAVYFKNPFRPTPFGTPRLLRLCPERTTGLELYHLVWKRVKDYVKDVEEPKVWDQVPASTGQDRVVKRIDSLFTGLNSSCGFVLRRVGTKAHADARSHWLTRSFGHLIPCNDEPLDLLEDEAVAIDWDLELFQDRETLDKMKHVEEHESVARSDAIDKGPVPLNHCLDAFTTEEKINEGYCSSCQSHVEMTKKLELWRLPPVMVIHLKRFQYTQSYRRKLVSLVEFPLTGLELSTCTAPHVETPEKYPTKEEARVKHCVEKDEDSVESTPASSEFTTDQSAQEGSDSKEENEEEEDAVTELKDVGRTSQSTSFKRAGSAGSFAEGGTRLKRGYTNTNLEESRGLETTYDLYGVVNHQGALGGGHYTAYAKNFVDEQWYYYDDERVRVVEESRVVNPSAYLLFYVRSDLKGMAVKDLYPPNKEGKITEKDIDKIVEEVEERRCQIM